MILSDTDCVIDFLKNRAPENGKVRRALIARELCVSAVTAFELYFGDPVGRGRSRLDQLFESIVVLPVTQRTAWIGAEQGTRLAGIGLTLAMPDLLIAAAALETGVPIVTRNVRHFSRIEGLEILEPG
ncbi:MAG: type II toxin-antitoxin system VapC family toxin [Dehalococcoidia bacterium]